VSTLPDNELRIHLPKADSVGLEQDEEYCELEADGERRRIALHDYGRIYDTPGLYEQLFAESLECCSPQVVVDLLHEVVAADGQHPGDLKVLDFAAGNGMVAEELARVGTGTIVGVDLAPEAKRAAERDRPGLYDDYYACDITELDPGVRRELEDRGFNGMTCVAALGFGDVPPEAFRAACDLVSTAGWVAFNIRDRFIDDGDDTGFSDALDVMLGGELVERARLRYPHRLSVSGEPLHYVAIVAQKAPAAA
jgi:hypothetical protein